MNVNLDVLELVLAHLAGANLVHAALVSRAFLAGAIPALYARIEYTARHAKRAQHEMSPFATLAAHGHLAVHVKRIAVHAAPLFQPAAHIVNPAFVHDLARALATTTNLRTFVCTVKILPPLLPLLRDKPRLAHLRLCAPLAARQMAVLQDCTGLHSLALDFPTWNVVDALPRWTASMQKTLAHLTLSMSQDADAAILNVTLAHLPRLRGLHVIGCLRISHSAVLRALSHTPDLRELSFTIFPSQENTLPLLNFPTPPLTHLSIDVRTSHPGLKSLIALIISRLSPRDALAICGGWIGEIRGSSERADPPQNGDGNGPAGPMPGHAHDQANDPLLLSPAVPHPGNAQPIQNPAAPPHPPNVFGFPNDNNNHPLDAGPPTPPNPDVDPDPNTPSLVSSFPSTLSTLHLPQISPTALKEVVNRCEGLQLLGIVMGTTFMTRVSAKPGRTTGRFKRHASGSGVRPEISALAGILSRARMLRELVVDTGPTDITGNGASPSMSAGTSNIGMSSGGYALLTRPAVRMLMREAPFLRRIVGEGRIWESPTPAPSSPVPFPHCLPIDLTLSPAHYGPGTGNNHVHGPPGFGTHGSGYSQVEAGNDHWFWLADSESAGKVYSGF